MRVAMSGMLQKGINDSRCSPDRHPKRGGEHRLSYERDCHTLSSASADPKIFTVAVGLSSPLIWTAARRSVPPSELPAPRVESTKFLLVRRFTAGHGRIVGYERPPFKTLRSLSSISIIGITRPQHKCVGDLASRPNHASLLRIDVAGSPPWTLPSSQRGSASNRRSRSPVGSPRLMQAPTIRIGPRNRRLPRERRQRPNAAPKSVAVAASFRGADPVMRYNQRDSPACVSGALTTTPWSAGLTTTVWIV
jgi:hypothetical protein